MEGGGDVSRKSKGPYEARKMDPPPVPARKGPTRNDLAIAALNAEARRRGMNYGKLVGILGPEEKAEIIRRYIIKKEGAAR